MFLILLFVCIVAAYALDPICTKTLLKTMSGEVASCNVHAVSQTGVENAEASLSEFELIEEELEGKTAFGHFVRLDNPLNHFSFLTPQFGCNVTHQYGGQHVETSMARTSETAKTFIPYEGAKPATCKIATNGGFYNSTCGECYGDVASGGELVQVSPHSNVNFGIWDGKFVSGYINSADIEEMNALKPFNTLISGMGWLVRDGESFIDVSFNELEDLSVQETGSDFVTLQSGRTVIGHDKDGKLMILQIDGRSYYRGVDLYTMAEIMINRGAVNAINLDGGGSTAWVTNGSLANYPSQKCIDDPSHHSCERPVATITCIHDFITPPEVDFDGFFESLGIDALAIVEACLLIPLSIFFGHYIYEKWKENRPIKGGKHIQLDDMEFLDEALEDPALGADDFITEEQTNNALNLPTLPILNLDSLQSDNDNSPSPRRPNLGRIKLDISTNPFIPSDEEGDGLGLNEHGFQISEPNPMKNDMSSFTLPPPPV
eukprot:TRINITY_DN781843_c0_g1_i1.p1 TRINITY_DN781843_c0_g1~~TRINITY_DN781843_c0_g1_i1.p1  ORF type:complete len:489 (+),score=112.14 TRINITY_DN781843_c0_g1_i1:108-1574(+)